MNTYQTTEVANIIGIHPNTVRLYEQLGFCLLYTSRERVGCERCRDSAAPEMLCSLATARKYSSTLISIVWTSIFCKNR